MMEKNKKYRFREEWKLFWRAVRLCNQIAPGYWFYQILCLLTDTFLPYFTIYMSAQLLNELAGNCDPQRLIWLAAITTGGSFILNLANRALNIRKETDAENFYHQQQAFILDKENTFQYEHLENPDIIKERNELNSIRTITHGGLDMVNSAGLEVLRNLLNIAFSVTLTVSMFRLSAEGNFSGILGFINSPFSALIIVAVIVLNIVLNSKIVTVQTQKLAEATSTLTDFNTRYFALEGNRGTDMIVFRMNRIVLDEYEKFALHPDWAIKMSEVKIRFGPLSILLSAFVRIVIFLFTAAKAYIGVFGIGNFVLYQGTIERFVSAITGLTENIGKLRFNSQYLERLFAYLDLPNEMYKGSLAVEKRDDIDYEIEFRDVSFKYPRTDTWVLRHVNMKFRIGDKLAIVGENGSGKTTFIKLLCRLYDPTEGRILLNGIDITRYRYKEYMELFSVVFQDYSLFAFPLGENVSAANTYDDARVRECLIRSGMGDKLVSLDNDPDAQEKDALKRAVNRYYDNEGIDFSGGERQKIALARALYKDAPFVILDEPTAALDPIAEAAVYENFNILVKDKTAVFISHRLSSCRFCDYIVVFDHGELIQEGSHDMLVSDENGKYYELWHAQAQYYAN